MKMLVYGLVTGLLFGFLLQKGRGLRYDTQLGALRLQDMTIVKFMLSSVIVGLVGVYLLSDLGLAKLSIKATILGPVLEKTVYTWGNLGRSTLPQVWGVSHWVIIPLFIAGALPLFWSLGKKGL
jgi:hypothetical protein